MEHLPQGVGDEEGCFIYQICDGRLAVRNALNVGDETMTEAVFENGELVSIDLVRPSRVIASLNGPFLRLSDCSGWLFEKKYGEVMMRKIPVSVGLWTFMVDNAPSGIALRKHPIDRSDMKVEGIIYKPMQKIHCDRKVQHPSTGINYYRVQGTEGWVFDRRIDENDGSNRYMLLEENMVETGVFVYECISDKGINIRLKPRVEDNCRTDLSAKSGELISANAIRKTPSNDGNGPFLRLSDGSGWLFEKKHNEQLMKRLLVKKGGWELEVVNSAGIALRRQPVDSQSLREPTEYPFGSIIRCTHMAQASSGIKFYRVADTDGWVFDKRDGNSMLILLSEEPSSENGSVFSNDRGGTGWTPDFVRGIAAAVKGVSELSFNERSLVISFVSSESENVRINVYYTTRTIGTALSHPSQGATQLFRRNCTTEELIKILENPRAHTGKGYKRRRNDPSSFVSSESIYTPYGRGLLADQESELRNELIDLDEEMSYILQKRRRILKRIRDADLERAEESMAFSKKVDKRNEEHIERKEKLKARIVEALRVALAEKEEEERRDRDLRNRTCQVCSRVFQNFHAKQQHYDAVHVFKCGICWKEFNNGHSLNQHKGALGHW